MRQQLTLKYRTFRRPPDAFYQSRILQNFFNKFIRRGKKARSRRHVYNAWTTLRYNMTRLKFDHALLRTLRQFRVRLKLHPKRRGVGMIYVPLPQHRIKGEFPGIQVIYAGVKARHDRTLQKRCEQEFESLFFHPERITAYQEAHITRVYEERANLDFRWK